MNEIFANAPGVLPDPGDVCVLDDTALGERLAWLGRNVVPHVTRAHRREDGWLLEITDEEGMAQKLDQWSELERACCSGIVFERVTGAPEGFLHFEIRGANPAASVFARFESLRAPERSSVNGTVVRSAGVGLLASLFVCCLLPIAAVAVLGSAAAPLMGLEGLVPMSLTGIGFGGAYAWWRSRSQRVSAGPDKGSDCGPGC